MHEKTQPQDRAAEIKTLVDKPTMTGKELRNNFSELKEAAGDARTTNAFLESLTRTLSEVELADLSDSKIASDILTAIERNPNAGEALRSEVRIDRAVIEKRIRGVESEREEKRDAESERDERIKRITRVGAKFGLVLGGYLGIANVMFGWSVLEAIEIPIAVAALAAGIVGAEALMVLLPISVIFVPIALAVKLFSKAKSTKPEPVYRLGEGQDRQDEPTSVIKPNNDHPSAEGPGSSAKFFADWSNNNDRYWDLYNGKP